MYVCMYVYIYIYMNIYIYTHLYTYECCEESYMVVLENNTIKHGNNIKTCDKRGLEHSTSHFCWCTL